MKMNMFDIMFGKQNREVHKGKTLDDKPLFNFYDKKSKYVEKSRFIFLGSIGSKDKKIYNDIKEVIKDMGYEDPVLFIRNNREILKFGVTETPALAVNGEVVTYGKHIKPEEVKKLIAKCGVK